MLLGFLLLMIHVIVVLLDYVDTYLSDTYLSDKCPSDTHLKYFYNIIDFTWQLLTCFPSSLHGLMASKIIDKLFVLVEK